MITLRQLDTRRKKDVRDWVALPYRIYGDEPLWAPQLVDDARFQLDREKNPFYLYGHADFFIAEKDGAPAGRIAVLENRRLNNLRGEKTAFFYLFETIEDIDVAAALFEKAEQWARRRGLQRLMGPKGFLTIDSVGMLAEGFERFPALGMAWNYPYYIDFMTRLGYEKETDYMTGWLPTNFSLPEKVFRLAEKVKARYGYHTQTFTSKEEIKPIINKVVDTYNRAFVNNWEFVPISDSELPVLVHRLLSAIQDPTLPRVVWKDDKIAGFILAYPDINRYIKKTNGRLWPLGWLHLLRGFKETPWIDLNGAGILPEYQGRGVDVVLMAEMWHVLNEADKHYQYAEVCQINEANEKMQREMRHLGITFDKRHRIFRKQLA